MSISFSTTTRGNGKVFTLIETDLEPARWTASSETLSGNEVPAKVFALDDGRWALVTPGFAVAQRAIVSALDADGKVIASAGHLINAVGASLVSKANTLVRNPNIKNLRNCDESPAPNEIAVYTMRLADVDDDNWLLHVAVFFPTYPKAEEDKLPSVELFGKNGTPIATGEPVLLGDLVEEYDSAPGVYYRSMLYSIPLESEVKWMCAYVSCEESGLQANFKCIRPYEIKGYLYGWRRILAGFEGPDPAYHKWVLENKPSEATLELQRQASEAFTLKPTFSVVVPLYHTPIRFFKDMAASVMEQSYPHFELVLVNSTPEDRLLAHEVRKLEASDERVRVVELDHNLGITENTNAGILASQGDFICFFDHDDILEPDILYWYAKGINDYPETDMLYCDEDKLLDGKYIDQFSKPDWDQLFLETNNYVCHMLTVRKSIIDSFDELPDKRFDGAQDHNMTFMVGERARNVYHARKVLYHWRVHKNSTALNGKSKPESLEAGRLAIANHLERLGLNARVIHAPNCAHAYIPIYSNDERPTIDAIVLPDQLGSDAKTTIESIRALGWDNIKIIDCSDPCRTDGIARRLNEAVRDSSGDYLLFITAGSTLANNDSLEQMLAIAMRSDVAIVSPKVVSPDWTNQHNGHFLYEGKCNRLHPYFYSLAYAHRSVTVLQHRTTAGNPECMMLSRSDFNAIGPLPEDAPDSCWAFDLYLTAHRLGLTIAQHPISFVVRSFGPSELSVNYSRQKLADTLVLAHLYKHYADVLFVPDRFYKPGA